MNCAELLEQTLRSSCKSYPSCASTTARDAEISDFVDVLAVFIRQQRSAEEEVDRTDFGREKDSSWAATYLIKVHGSVTAWKRTGKNDGDIDRLEKDRIICVPDWQNERFWRRDYVWIQKYPPEEKNRRGRAFPWEGRMVGQLQLLFTVQDESQRNAREDHPYYTRAMVELFQWKDHGNIHPTHGMVEVERWRDPTSLNPRILTNRKVILLPNIVRSAHVVPAGPNPTFWYINNYIDWDQFNTLYNPEFLSIGTRVADKIATSYGKR